MPIYEYECESCSHRFEEIQSIFDDPVEVCKLCNEPVKRVLSPVAVRFSGSGWWQTDYRNKRSDGTSKSESATSKESGEAKSGSSSDE